MKLLKFKERATFHICIPPTFQTQSHPTIEWDSSHTASIFSSLSREAQLSSIRQMSGQVLRGSAGEYQADERAGVARLSCRVSGR